MSFTFIKHDTNIDFIGKRFWVYGASAVLILIGIISAVWGNGLKMGIDFAGGVIVQVQFQEPVADEALKKGLDTPALPGITTQRFGEGGRDYLLRFSSAENADATHLRTTVMDSLAATFPGNTAEIVRLEIVGPKVGADLTNKASARCITPFCSSLCISPAVLNSAGWLAPSWRLPFGAAFTWPDSLGLAWAGL